MSEPSNLRTYRANVNLPRIRCGQLIEIDDSDGRWSDWIGHGLISAVGPPIEPYVPQAPWEDPDEPDVVDALPTQNDADDTGTVAETP